MFIYHLHMFKAILFWVAVAYYIQHMGTRHHLVVFGKYCTLNLNVLGTGYT